MAQWYAEVHKNTKPEVTPRNRALHEIQKEEEPYKWEQRDDSRNVDVINIKCLNSTA